MTWIALWLCGCGLLPQARTVQVDSGDPWDIPAEYTDAAWLQVATFNSSWLWAAYGEGYTPRNTVDYAMIARLFQGFDLDLVGLQEVDGEGALALLELPEPWAWAVGETGWSQNPAILWRADRLRVENVREVHLEGNEWPTKDPLVADVQSLDGSLAFTFVVVHHAAYSDNESAAQRYAQAVALHAWLVDELATEQDHAPFSDHVLVGGDFNDAFTPLNSAWPSLEVFEDDPGFAFATRDAEDYSQISYRSLIDHLVLSEALWSAYRDMGQPGACQVVAHDLLSPWSDYDGGYGGRQNISDHRPVWIYLAVEHEPARQRVAGEVRSARQRANAARP
jgi:endonuclease/exonuclease/phosphatase family metal-dependent hydrolase